MKCIFTKAVAVEVMARGGDKSALKFDTLLLVSCNIKILK
jgi:hypothetical protein